MGYQCINVDINGILVGIVGIIYIYIYVFMGYFHVILPSCNHLDVENPLFVDHVPKENHCGFFRVNNHRPGEMASGGIQLDQSLARKGYIKAIFV